MQAISYLFKLGFYICSQSGRVATKLSKTITSLYK